MDNEVMDKELKKALIIGITNLVTEINEDNNNPIKAIYSIMLHNDYSIKDTVFNIPEQLNQEITIEQLQEQLRILREIYLYITEKLHTLQKE
jgi:hypothetical protein